MKWNEQSQTVGQTDKKYTAYINSSLTITLNIAAPQKGKQSRACYMKLSSGNVPIHNASFGAYDEDSAKTRAVNEARQFIETSLERYRNMLDALEKADSEA